MTSEQHSLTAVKPHWRAQSRSTRRRRLRGEDSSAARSDGLLAEAPRWLLIGALVYIPWAYGGTRPWAVTGLNLLMGVILVLWLFGCLVRCSWPRAHPVLLVAALFLAAQQWFMILNAKYDYDSFTHEFITLEPLLPWAPGTLHKSLAAESALQISAMLVAVCFACDMGRRSVWRKRLLWTIALTGVSLVLLGLAQRLTNAPSIFWREDFVGKTFFATYRYHSNAGAFINLIWPIVAGFVALAFLRGSATWKKVLWVSALVFCLAGVFVNASRAASVLAIMLACFCGAWVAWQTVRGRFENLTPAATIVAGLVMVLLIAAVATLAGLDTSIKRWSRFGREVTTENPRLLVAKVCLDMIPQAGPWGFGPGTFQTAFPYFTQRVGDQARGRWLYAHQDSLQTLIEWGYLGSASWAVLMFGGILHSLILALRHRDRLSDSARLAHFSILVALLGVLSHTLVDFPLQVASIQLYVACLLGLLWASKHWLGDDTHSSS